MRKSAVRFAVCAFVVLAVLAGVPGHANPPSAAFRACAQFTPVGFAHCHALVRVGADGQPIVTGLPNGLGPPDYQSAYKIPANGIGTTIAIVDAYDNRDIIKNAAHYRQTYGLPCPFDSQFASGCNIKKIDQNGGTKYPRGDTGWGLEIALDVDTVMAICPRCNILLVEANSNSFDDLMTAVDQAVSQGATVISNSYGAGEFSGETQYDSHFNHPGVAITVSSGDGGYGIEYPAASPYVTAVGGTYLHKDSSARGWSETVWGGAGSGCSSVEPSSTWQQARSDLAGVCSRRGLTDVSAVADPNSGAAVYDTYGYGGWLVVGGTSLAAPLIGGVYALAGNAGSTVYASYPYSHTSALFDITSGSNGSCGGSRLCTGAAGWDGPTGLGTPNGTGAF